MITGWIGLESVLLPILITHQNSIWFWLLSRNFLLCFISVHSCITINETSVFITMEFSGWYIFDQDQNDEIQWRMLCRQKILKVWHPELLMKYLSQWQSFVFIMSDTNPHYSSVHLWNDYRAVCDVFYTKVSCCDLSLIWLLILPSSCYTFPCILLGRIWYCIKITASNW